MKNKSQRPPGILNQEKEIFAMYSRWHFIFNLNLFLSSIIFFDPEIYSISLSVVEQEQVPQKLRQFLKSSWIEITDLTGYSLQ